ncbi:MAG: radical SAM protein [Candidatus Brocadiia bacterium]
MATELTICELFRSIQGESTHAGRRCAFVRATGCNLACSWCDTPYARSREGESVPVDELCRRVERLGCRLVCITGGEPLLQAEATCALARELLGRGHEVLLETNGSLDVSRVPDGVVRVMDVKCPGSGECGSTMAGNPGALGPEDEVKFVISDRRDFEWALGYCTEHDLWGGPAILLAPAWGRLEGAELAEWILECDRKVRLQLQLHKLLWPGRERGV